MNAIAATREIDDSFNTPLVTLTLEVSALDRTEKTQLVRFEGDSHTHVDRQAADYLKRNRLSAAIAENICWARFEHTFQQILRSDAAVARTIPAYARA